MKNKRNEDDTLNAQPVFTDYIHFTTIDDYFTIKGPKSPCERNYNYCLIPIKDNHLEEAMMEAFSPP